MGRILGVDWGQVRIGLAISDEAKIIAQGLATIKVISKKQVLQEIGRVVKKWEIEEIVVGVPRKMSGEWGEEARQVQEWAGVLEKEWGEKVTLWDERLSSAAAERSLLEGDLRRGKRKKLLDKTAAALILQNYLDYRGRKNL